MSSQLVRCRNMIVDAITAYQQSPGFPYNGFSVAASCIPFQRIEDPNTQLGKVWVIGSHVDEKDRKTRHDPSGNTPPLVMREICCQVAYQQSNISPDDLPTVDSLLWTQELIRDVVKNYNYIRPATPSFNPLWVRNETLKDDNGQPFHYMMLREANTFETYFSAYFVIPHQ